MADEYLNRAGAHVLAGKIKENAQYGETLTAILAKDHATSLRVYATLSDRPSAIDVANGVLLAVGERCFVVATGKYYTVTAVNNETNAITWLERNALFGVPLNFNINYQDCYEFDELKEYLISKAPGSSPNVFVLSLRDFVSSNGVACDGVAIVANSTESVPGGGTDYPLAGTMTSFGGTESYRIIIAGDALDSGNPEDEFTVNLYALLSEKDAQTKFMSSPATFVVNSNETLAAWANHAAGNDYSSVYIASGTYTLASGGVNLTAAGTKQVEGHPSSKLVFSSLTPVDGNYSAALYYTSRPTDPTYSIKNVNVECVGAAATSANNYPCGFRNCLNLSNCSAYARATGTKAYQAAYGYYACQNLYNCFGAASGCNNGNAYTFSASSYLTNCVADETAYPAAYDAQADIIPYASCSFLVNCESKSKNGYELTRGFFGCSYLTGCTAELTQDNASTTVTEISGFNRCSRIMNCRTKLSNNSTKTLTNIGGVINSTMVMNTVSEGGQMYNSTHLTGNNATAYTQCYADDYTTAVADTAAGGFNHTGVLAWKNNKWENA